MPHCPCDPACHYQSKPTIESFSSQVKSKQLIQNVLQKRIIGMLLVLKAIPHSFFD
jgi:hypothetical protein